ncbi:SDR family NAD(P)-dependent oxidoreductase [Actinoplanes sp. NBRC 101535]|uniref:SDR family NAD(P)-dependent oxidoreductase n=1 Tax=Actinoplanes sp. NBRC 101535 TaxID=3032196 RepID=UPI0024A0CDC7|nr:SDR family NAD(P)-dependent oxidoreductase [Actinoplanes sp. NBRC 101535]GLY07989.1 short-chain dehydrogenase/reductase [Actinoplanes sp. NBRC 101535]
MQKIWFITGASSGFGRLWAQAALERGDRVAVAARSAVDPALVERFGDAVLPLTLDVTDREAVFAAVDHVVQRFGRIDVVVNAAGYGHVGMVEEVTERELRRQMETNFFGAVWVTQAVLPVLRRQNAGHLLQVTSEGGVRAYPGFGAYHASKWAVEGLTEALALETAGFGFHVTLVEPGPYATGFVGAIHQSAESPAYPRPEIDFRLGDPTATTAALLALVDAENPPRRLVMGDVLPEIEAIYEQRLTTWRDWAKVSLDAFGSRVA